MTLGYRNNWHNPGIKKLMDKSAKAEERARDLQTQAEDAELRVKRIENELKKMEAEYGSQ